MQLSLKELETEKCSKKNSLREKCPYSEFLNKSLYSVQTQNNTDQKNSKTDTFHAVIDSQKAILNTEIKEIEGRMTFYRRAVNHWIHNLVSW